MAKQSFLTWLVVIRRDNQCPVRTQSFRGAGGFYGVGCRVGTCASKDESTLVDVLNGEANYLLAFILGERR